MCDTLQKYNVSTDGVITDKSANTTLAVVSVNENGEHSFAFYRKNSADKLLSEYEIIDLQLRNTHILIIPKRVLTAVICTEESLIGTLPKTAMTQIRFRAGFFRVF